jgi:GDP-L-fucose synthase
MDKNSRILITGGTGFLGTNLTAKLLEQGYKQIVPVGRQNKYNLEDGEQTYDLIRGVKPDIIFHLAAAVGGIGANRKSPADFWFSNTMMGANILNATKSIGVERLVIVGTTCSYPKYCPIPFKESDIWNGFPEETNAPYGVAKKSIMLGAKAYAQQYGLDVVCPILTNLYGPGDHYTKENSHVIPDMIRKFHEAKLAKQKITLWGDGSPTRDFLYVQDACEGLIKIASIPCGPDPINFGSGNEVSMYELAEQVSQTVGYHGGVQWDARKPNGQPKRLLDITRARDLGWAPTTKLEHGLMVTYEDFLGRSSHGGL